MGCCLGAYIAYIGVKRCPEDVCTKKEYV